MLFLGLTIFSLNAFVYENKKYLYILPLVSLLWANMHSGVVLMFVPFFAFIVGGYLQHRAAQKYALFHPAPSLPQLRTVLIVFAASVFTSLATPYFIDQYSFGSQVLATPWFKQEILELQPPTWEMTRWPYLMTAFVVASFLLARKQLSLIQLFLVLPFMVLPFTAFRFISVQAIVLGPVLARNISMFFNSNALQRLQEKKGTAILVAVWLLVYSAGTYANTFTVNKNRQSPGFGVNYAVVPEKALQFMDARGIDGRISTSFDGAATWRGEILPGASSSSIRAVIFRRAPGEIYDRPVRPVRSGRTRKAVRV